MPANHEALVSKVAFWLLLTCIGSAFVPAWAGMDMMRGGFAMISFCVFFAIVAGVTWLVFRRRARILDRFLSGRDVLATWQVPPETWTRHVAVDLEAEKQGKKVLFLITAFWCALIGGGFALFADEGGGIVALVLAGVLLILVPFAFWLPRRRAARLARSTASVIVGRDGVLVGGELHDWKLAGSFFCEAAIDDSTDPNTLRFDYAYLSPRAGLVPVEVRAPIPPGKEAEARRVMETLNGLPERKPLPAGDQEE